MKKIFIIALIALISFYIGKLTQVVLPKIATDSTLSNKYSRGVSKPILSKKISTPMPHNDPRQSVNIALYNESEKTNSEKISELIKNGKSNLLFQAIFDKKLFEREPITLDHINDLRSRFSEKKDDDSIMHKSLSDMKNRDLMALLQAFSMNKQVYRDLKIRNAYLKLLRNISMENSQTLVVRRQAVRSLAQISIFMTENDKQKLWKDINPRILSLAAYSDVELVGAINEK